MTALPINYGLDHNYFNRLTISASTFSSTADVIIPIKASDISILLINEGSHTISYSFNGTTIHGDLVPSTPSSALVFKNRGVSQIWFISPAGSSALRIEACSDGALVIACGS